VTAKRIVAHFGLETLDIIKLKLNVSMKFLASPKASKDDPGGLGEPESY